MTQQKWEKVREEIVINEDGTYDFFNVFEKRKVMK